MEIQSRISATIVADSLNIFGQRLTTLKVVMPRIVLAEFNTHRALTRNSASSRAIPFKRMHKSVSENMFMPIGFLKEHKGMQGFDYFDGEELVRVAHKWRFIASMLLSLSMSLHLLGVSKQICNRILEPFMYHTVLVSATEWSNFMALRDHKDAEIHIQAVARSIKEAMDNSTPKQLQPGEWHIPFGDKFDIDELVLLTDDIRHVFRVQEGIADYKDTQETLTKLKVKIATARCARLSYLTLGAEPKIDYEADIKLHDMLLKDGHMSPFEHVARAMSRSEMLNYGIMYPYDADVHEKYTYDIENEYPFVRVIHDKDSVPLYIKEDGWCGNFRGFIQYRKLIPNENR
jgi:thymidylate synthase ThyX